MRIFTRWIGAAMVGVALLFAYRPVPAEAARVSGILTGYENSAPQASRDLHFQNEITHDVFLSPTHSDGSFGANLPPGLYSLRTETGAILKRNIRVDNKPVTLGNVSELAPYAPARLFDYQSIFHSILTSPAPSTAYIMTVDKTVPPPNAPVVPKPEVNWSKPPPGTEASRAGANVATAAPANQPVEPRQVPSGTSGAMGGQAPMSSPMSSGMGGGQPATAMPPP